MKERFDFPAHTWDWGAMGDEDKLHWSLCGSVSYSLMDRWKLNAGDKKPRVLDLGCGMGRNSLKLSQNGLETYGLDIDEMPLAVAKSNANRMAEQITYVQGDMRCMPFASNFFDAVFADNILSLTSHNGLVQTIDEIHRVLKPHGEAFMVFTDKSMPLLQTGQMVDQNTIKLHAQYGKHSAVATFVDEDILKRVLRGFSVLDKSGILHGYKPDRFHHMVLAMKIKER